MFGGAEWVIYSTSMGREHDSDPLVSPRDDEPGDEPGAAGEQPFDQEQGTPPVEPDSPERDTREPDTREPDTRGPDSRERDPIAEREPGAATESAPAEAPGARRRRSASPNMLPARKQRGIFERTFVRLVATGGVVGIGVVIAAIMASSNSQAWLIGLVVSVVSVVLAALLWSSRIL